MHLGFSVLVICLVCFIVYIVVPDIILYRLGIGTWKRHIGPGVALTFDDGPDPQYTPRVLEVLEKYNATATFFLVGAKVEQHPDLVGAILQAGHQIGAHSQRHVNARYLSPWGTWREWNNSINSIEKVSAKRVDFVRPPWGAFNAMLWLWCVVKRKRPVYWSADGEDWFADHTPEMIATRALRHVSQGSTILLHDSGGEAGAPANTIAALEFMCEALLTQYKLPIVRLEFPAI
ncbi:MAG: polysaccharide deacetylase family protein [Peptococcaceae bacterium]|nr:polysaccharide deacetylase family protein [Peptococcaceae bacterium]